MNKEIVGFTAGNFDLLHPGYIITFEEAKKHCDRFLVFLQKDPSLHRKSKYKPVIPLYDRYKALMSIRYIDEVYTYQTEDELYELIKFWKPDVRILGEDYMTKDSFTGDDLPPKIIYTSRSHGWSTTMLKDRITKQTLKQNPDISKIKLDQHTKKVIYYTMYQNIYLKRNKGNVEVHLWDDQVGYQKFNYKHYAYQKSGSGVYRSIYGDKLIW